MIQKFNLRVFLKQYVSRNKLFQQIARYSKVRYTNSPEKQNHPTHHRLLYLFLFIALSLYNCRGMVAEARVVSGCVLRLRSSSGFYTQRRMPQHDVFAHHLSPPQAVPSRRRGRNTCSPLSKASRRLIRKTPLSQK